MRELARIRALWLELGQALDAAEAEEPTARAVRKSAPRRVRWKPPEQPASPEAIAEMRRTLRRKGVAT